jgi:heme A synthase
MATLAGLQFLLGVLTLINFVPGLLAVAHQFIGLCLFGTSVMISWSLSAKPNGYLKERNNAKFE